MGQKGVEAVLSLFKCRPCGKSGICIGECSDWRVEFASVIRLQIFLPVVL